MQQETKDALEKIYEALKVLPYLPDADLEAFPNEFYAAYNTLLKNVCEILRAGEDHNEPYFPDSRIPTEQQEALARSLRGRI